MAALMTFEMSSTEKVAEYREECSAMGIGIEPPGVNTSEFDFVVESDIGASARNGSTSASLRRGVIRFGLGAIKGVGQKAVAAIIEARQRGGAFRNLFDFCERVDLTAVNKGTIEALICAGAFDATGGMRRALCDAAERAMSVGLATQRDRRSGQMALFGGAESSPTSESSPPMLTTAEWPEAEMLAREKAVLGFYITKHPLAKYERLLDACATATTADLTRFKEGDEVIVGGLVTGVRMVTTRTGRNVGKAIGIVTLEDLAGKVEAVLFSEELTRYRPLLVADAVVFVVGVVDRKREEPSVRVSRVVPVDRATTEFAKALLINVTEDTPLNELTRLFQAHRGECRVFLNVPTSDGLLAQIECNPLIRVACTAQLLNGLAGWVPPNAVKLLSAKRQLIQPILEPQLVG